MNKIIGLVTVLLIGFSQYGFTQNNTFVPSYIALKDALVTDNSTLASAKAAELAKQFSGTSQGLTKKDHEVLLKAANRLAESKDITFQREQLETISDTLIKLAKESKLTEQPLYVMYCPMKKSSWLSTEKGIKNPYYGKSMLTCGTIKETLN